MTRRTRLGTAALVASVAAAIALATFVPQATSASVGSSGDVWPEGNHIIGYVVDKDGRPLANAEVRAYSLDPAVPDSVSGTVINGKFWLWGVDGDADYYVVARWMGDGDSDAIPQPGPPSWYPNAMGSENLAETIRVRTRGERFVLDEPIVVGDDLGAIENITSPSISGDARVNGWLHTDAGTWNEPGVRRMIRWYADGKILGSETGNADLFVHEGLLGKTITADVLATKQGYRSTKLASTNRFHVEPAAITPVTDPTIIGDPVVGSTLRATNGTWRTARGPRTALGYRHTWLRDGKAVGTGRSYRLTKKDVGASLKVRVVATRAAHRPTTATSRKAAPVKKLRSRTSISIRDSTAPRVTVVVDVVAPKGSVPRGRVTLKDAGAAIKTVQVRKDGRAVFRLDDVRSGSHRLTAVYSGSSLMSGSKAAERVTIRR